MKLLLYGTIDYEFSNSYNITVQQHHQFIKDFQIDVLNDIQMDYSQTIRVDIGKKLSHLIFLIVHFKYLTHNN